MDVDHEDLASDEDEIYEDDDYATPKETYTADLGDGYTCTTKLLDFEEDATEVKGEIMYNNKQVGSMDGWLVARGWRNNFYSSCDAVSAELQLLANVLFHRTGRLNKMLWRTEFTSEQIIDHSHGNFLNIDIIRVEEAHRKKDLGFKYMQHLFEALEGQWTISVVVPGLERSKLEGEAHKVKVSHVCQLLARCGYKFLPIESNTSYWYIVPDKVKKLTKNDVKNVKDEVLSNENWSDYKNKLHTIYSGACFEEALVIGYEEFRKRPADRARALEKYQDCYSSMPPEVKSILVGGLVAPRMFNLLRYTVETQADNLQMDVDDAKPRTRISTESLEFTLFDCIPKEITRNGVYKSFLAGFVQILHTMGTIMGATNGNQLPTKNRVLSLLEGTAWPPSYRHFFEKGGRIDHVYNGIIDFSKNSSWAYGDGSYDEILDADDERVPFVDILDNDFHYVETIVVKYLLEN